ncbi:hypothetical protein H6758_00655 [Candidatus Nomurabacteria bacterium]|nr:hypothetical protein [Candidatus Nomurabacteria bacterium]
MGEDFITRRLAAEQSDSRQPSFLRFVDGRIPDSLKSVLQEKREIEYTYVMFERNVKVQVGEYTYVFSKGESDDWEVSVSDSSGEVVYTHGVDDYDDLEFIEQISQSDLSPYFKQKLAQDARVLYADYDEYHFLTFTDGGLEYTIYPDYSCECWRISVHDDSGEEIRELRVENDEDIKFLIDLCSKGSSYEEDYE